MSPKTASSASTLPPPTPSPSPPTLAPSPPAPTKEAIDRLSGVAGGWIGAADTKAAALLGVSNILLGAAFLEDMTPGVPGGAELRVLFIVLVLAQHLVVAVGVLWPRTNRAAILRAAGFPTPLSKSPSFYADIAKLNHASYIELLADSSTQESDRTEQAYILAVIASKKMCAYKLAIVLFVTCLAVFCGLALTTAVAREKQSEPTADAPATISESSSTEGTPAVGDSCAQPVPPATSSTPTEPDPAIGPAAAEPTPATAVDTK